MKEIYVLTELYLHNEHGQRITPYTVPYKCGAAAKRLVKKGLANTLVDEPPNVALHSVTEKGAQVMKMIQGMLNAL